ncbi:hypothetical protein FRC15_001836 [Serendipita sp. 397]|nr:hypothetical protein FRC15_001836 [Serendipita sp. 397]
MLRSRRVATLHVQSYSEQVSDDGEKVSSSEMGDSPGLEESSNESSDSETEDLLPNSGRNFFPTVPDAAQVAQARLHIDILSRECSELEAEHEAQRSIMIHIESRLNSARQKLLQERALVAPIRRLPQEILSIIFHVHVHENQQSPWVLMHVSRSWRGTTLFTGALWSKIMPTSNWISTKTERRSRIHNGMEVCVKDSQIRRALARANGAPLDLFLYIRPTAWSPANHRGPNSHESAISSMLRAINYTRVTVPNKPKLRSLEIDTPQGFMLPTDPLKLFDFSTLERLKFDRDYPDIIELVNSSTCRLSSLTIPSHLVPKLQHKPWIDGLGELGILQSTLITGNTEESNRGCSRRLLETCAKSLVDLHLRGNFSAAQDAIEEPRIETPLLKRLELDRLKYFWPVECRNITHLRLVLCSNWEDWTEKICLPNLVNFDCVVIGGKCDRLLSLDMPELHTFRLRLKGGKFNNKLCFNTLWPPNGVVPPSIDPVVFILEVAPILPRALGACLATLTLCEELLLSRTVIDSSFFEEIEPKKASTDSAPPKKKKGKGMEAKRRSKGSYIALNRLRRLDISMENTKVQPDEPQLIGCAKDFVSSRKKVKKPLEVMRINLPKAGLTEIIAEPSGDWLDHHRMSEDGMSEDELVEEDRFSCCHIIYIWRNTSPLLIRS